MAGESSFENIPVALLEGIAFFIATSGPDDSFFGPPSGITPLLLTSSTINRKLSFKFTSHLYSRIFRYKFDINAVTRRLSVRWTTTRALRTELINRCCALKRIKAVHFDAQDLWTVYLMLLEDDGRNSAQLLVYAGLRHYIRELIVQRAESQAQDSRWFKQPMMDTLILWVYWLISDRESILREGHILRSYLIAIADSVIITGFNKPSVYAPDVFFYLPLRPEDELVDDLAAMKTEILHFSHRLQVVAPVIAPVAALITTVFAERAQTLETFPDNLPLPLDRADAVAQGRRGATVADARHFHFHNRIRMRAPYSSSIEAIYNLVLGDGLEVSEEDSEGGALFNASAEARGSRSHDSDWYRLVSCHDPWGGSHKLRGPVYKLGSLSGSWSGRLLVPDVMLQFALAIQHNSSSNRPVSIRHQALYFELQEHHCLDPETPVPAGTDNFLDSDNILNAYFPSDVAFIHHPDGVDVYDPTTGRVSQYAAFGSRDAAQFAIESHAESNKTVIADTGLDSEVGSADPSRIDDDDEYEDTVSHKSSGVHDIVVTGKTGEIHGEGWGHFTIYGRVRPWDGLVVLRRFPTNTEDAHLGTLIFKGYIHGPNLVGKWRETNTPASAVGFEGGFVVCRD